MKKKAYIICGPTASGKSILANKLAKKNGGAIINADSMQLYNALEMLSASPNADEKKELKHFLYNFVSPNKRYNLGDYIKDCQDALNLACDQDLVPIIVGGTGMYINGLIEGISNIPEISNEIRDSVQNQIATNTVQYVHQLLEKCDPKSASKINSADTQRVGRSYEVFLQTGKSILEFQKEKTKSILSDFVLEIIYLKPSREFLYKNCDTRFMAMVNSGVIDEVQEFRQKYPEVNFGISNALGFKELWDYLENNTNLEEAIITAQTKTRNYAKRQFTWFNNQLKNHEKKTLTYSNLSEFLDLNNAINNI